MEKKPTIKEFIRSTDFFPKFFAALDNLERSDFSLFEGLQDGKAVILEITFPKCETVNLSKYKGLTQLLTEPEPAEAPKVAPENPATEEKLDIEVNIGDISPKKPKKKGRDTTDDTRD